MNFRVLFDSSALIAAFIEAHTKHDVAFEWLKRAKMKEFDFVVSAHSVLEVYSVLTSAPFRPEISPKSAKKIIDNNIKKDAKIIYLTNKEYYSIIDHVSTLKLRGGIVYDAIILQCARKSNASKILTSNIKDFSRILLDDSINVISL